MSAGRIALAAACALGLAAPAFAQDTGASPPPSPTQGPMTVERVHDGFLIAPDFKATSLGSFAGSKTRIAPLPGVYGGWVLDNTLLIGAGGYWLASHAEGVHDMGYGGLVVEWLQRTDRSIGYSVRGLVGGGEATLTQTVVLPIRTLDRDPRPPGPPPALQPATVRFRRDFFVAEPQANVLFNLADRLRVSIGAGYRFTGTDRTDDGALRGATASIALQVGGSSTRRLP